MTKIKYALLLLVFLLFFKPSVYGYNNHEFTDEQISALSESELNNVISNIPTMHPRIFLKASEIEALKARVGIGSPSDYNFNTLKWRGKSIAFGEMASEYQILKNMVETYENDPEGMWEAVDSGKRPKHIGWAAGPYAFVNLLEPKTTYVSSAKYLLDKALANPQGGQGSDGGEQAWKFAVAYDWLSADLTPSEKEKYIEYMLDQGEIFGFVGRSGNHFPKLYDLSNLNSATGLRSLFIGFAIFNDQIGPGEINENNREAKKIIKDYGGFFKRVAEGYKMAGGQTGGYQEDFGHAQMALGGMLPLVELWYHATNENLFTGFNTLKYWPLWNLHLAKPNGDTLNSIPSNPISFDHYRNRGEFELLANRYQDEVIQTIAERYSLKNDGYLWKEILWKDSTLNNNVNLNTLPKAKQFNPVGFTFVRSGWDISSNSDDFYAAMISGRMFPSNRVYLMGSFAIYYKGDLVSNAYGDNFCEEHNLIMLDSDCQIMKSGPKDGSSSDIVGWKNYDVGTRADLSRFIKFETKDTYTYSHAELHEIYDASKLDYWTREFLYLNPAQDKHYFLVYDRVTTDNADVDKKNYVHLKGGTSVGDDTYRGDDGGGRAFMKILYPESFSVSGNAIIPSTDSVDDKFLNVFHVTDDSVNSMTSTSRIEADTMVGTLIEDSDSPQVVLFSSDHGGADVSSATYDATYSGNGRHLLLGMTPFGEFDIYKNSVKILTSLTASSEGVLSFSESGGSTFQVVQTGVSPPVYECSDGVDNDGDGLVDYPDDPGCQSSTDNDESNSTSDTTPPSPPTGLRRAVQ